MAGVFSDIEVEWNGDIYTIKSHRVMGAISRIEDVITMPELQVYASKGTAPVGKLCMAFGSVLRYAGAKVKDEDVYGKLFAGEEQQQAIMMSITNIMKMMMPASVRAKLEAVQNGEAESSEDEGIVDEEDLGNSLPAVEGASSKRRTKQRSAKANG